MPAPTDRYQAIVEAFLQFGPRFAEVGRAAGVSTQAAQNAWYKGIADLGHPPIANIFRELVRRRQDLVEEKGRTEVLKEVAAPTPVEAVRQSAHEAAFTEVDILAEFRRNVVSALGLSNGILTQLDRLAQAVTSRLVEEAENAPYVSVETLLGPLEKLTKATNNMAATTKTVFELQRLLQGSPQTISEHRSTGNPGVSPELQEKLVQAGNVLDMMRRHRGLLPAEAEVIDVDADSAYEGEESHGEAAAALGTAAEPAVAEAKAS